MPQQGYKTEVLGHTGVTAATGDSMTDTGDGLTFRDTFLKSFWDPTASVTVYDNGSPVAAGDYTIDYFFGLVTFDSSPTGPITVDRSYFDLDDLSEINGLEATMSRALEEVTVLGDTAVDRLPLLTDFVASLESFAQPIADFDPSGGGAKNLLDDALESGDWLALQIDPDGDNDYVYRAFVHLESLPVSQAVASVLQMQVAALGAIPDGAAAIVTRSWAYGTSAPDNS